MSPAIAHSLTDNYYVQFEVCKYYIVLQINSNSVVENIV